MALDTPPSPLPPPKALTGESSCPSPSKRDTAPGDPGGDVGVSIASTTDRAPRLRLALELLRVHLLGRAFSRIALTRQRLRRRSRWWRLDQAVVLFHHVQLTHFVRTNQISQRVDHNPRGRLLKAVSCSRTLLESLVFYNFFYLVQLTGCRLSCIRSTEYRLPLEL